MKQVVIALVGLKAVDGSHFSVTGELGFDTAKTLLAAGVVQFAAAESRFEVDLSGVSQSDSAGLALLIEWLKVADRVGKRISYTRVPAQLRALARISEIEDFLPMAAG